jgi:hypothetical protein
MAQSAREGSTLKIHWHFSAENVLFAGISAIIVINLTRFAAAKMAAQPGVVGTIGNAIGATVTF